MDRPITDQEKLIIIKKNINSTYAPIAASHHSIRLQVKAQTTLEINYRTGSDDLLEL